MYSKINILLTGLFCLLFLTFCAESEDRASSQQTEVEATTEPQAEPATDLQIEYPRARPAREGSMSAAYLRITNNTASVDTLLSISSDIAQLLEIHESFEQDDGMMGMRETGALEIPVGTVVHLEPGGYHIMLMRLNEDLEIGQTFDLTLHFAQKGDETVQVTVQQI